MLENMSTLHGNFAKKNRRSFDSMESMACREGSGRNHRKNGVDLKGGKVLSKVDLFFFGTLLENLCWCSPFVDFKFNCWILR